MKYLFTAFVLGISATSPLATTIEMEFSFGEIDDQGFLSALGVVDPVETFSARLIYDDLVPARSSGPWSNDGAGGSADRARYDYSSFVISIGGVDIASPTNVASGSISVIDGLFDGTIGSDYYDSFSVFSGADVSSSWGTLTNVNFTTTNYDETVISGTDIPSAQDINNLNSMFDSAIFFGNIGISGLDQNGNDISISGKFVSANQPNDPADIAPVPLPAGFPLLVTALGMLGLLRRRT